MKTLLSFLWSIAKLCIALFLFCVAYTIASTGGEGAWSAVVVLLIALSFHWRFWIVAIPAFFIGAAIGKRL